MVNLAGKAEFIEVQEQLDARLGQWITETADPFDTGARDAKTGILRLGQRFTNSKWETGRPLLA